MIRAQGVSPTLTVGRVTVFPTGPQTGKHFLAHKDSITFYDFAASVFTRAKAL